TGDLTARRRGAAGDLSPYDRDRLAAYLDAESAEETQRAQREGDRPSSTSSRRPLRLLCVLCVLPFLFSLSLSLAEADVKQLLDGVWTWSVFDEPRQLDFNGYYVDTGTARALIDPVPWTPEVEAAIERLGRPTDVIITNKDHRRAAARARERFG